MRSNERGSIVVAIVLGAGLFMGALALFQYLNASRVNLSYATQVSIVDSNANYIVSKISRCLTFLDDSSPCPKLTELQTMLNLSNSAPAPVNYTMNDLLNQTGFMTDRKAELNTIFSSITVSIIRQASADDVTYGNTSVSITIEVAPKSNGAAMNKRKYTHNYRIGLQTPSSFALVSRFDGANAAILTKDGSTVAIYGGMLLWTTTGSVSPAAIISNHLNSSLLVDQIVSRATSLAIGSSADTKAAEAFRNRGVTLNALTNATDPFISPAFWNQKLDYYYVFASNDYPLPTTAPIAAHGVDSSGLPIKPYDSTRAGVKSFPNASIGLSTLEATCAMPADFSTGSMSGLVLLAKDSNLSFDFTPGSGGAPSQYACGMIIASRVTITIPNGATAVWYGHINAERLVVEGGGKLVIVNPFTPNDHPTSLPIPTGMSLGDIASMFTTLASSTAHNFFAPFARDSANLPASFQYTMISSYFIPCNLANTASCWSISVSPPDIAQLMSASAPIPWYNNVFMGARESL